MAIIITTKYILAMPMSKTFYYVEGVNKKGF